MVVEEKFNGEQSYKCEECGFHYTDRRMAEKCEEHCRDYDACDTEITENSLERSQ